LEKEYRISIIGLGYVDLPLAFSEYYKVLVYDVNEKWISDLSKGIDSNPAFTFKSIVLANQFDISKEKLVLLNLKDNYGNATWRF
jgi:UDP-N-acetyl-D-mannosaminuronate dehydrogenase